MKRLFNRASNWSRRSEKKPNNAKRTLRFEHVEDRRVMSVSPLVDNSAISKTTEVYPWDGPKRAAEGSITLDSSNGTLTVLGSQTLSDNVKIYINHRAGNGAGNIPDLFTVQLSNRAGVAQVRAFDMGVVQKIVVKTFGGNDFVDNRTAVSVNAFGGVGNDILLGGSLDDYIYGEDGDDFIDGRGDGDMLFGQAGSDKLFGDEGVDSLYGGTENDYLFGGNNADYLYGEGGDDALYGGADLDRLIDNSGTNKLIQDYAPEADVHVPTISSFNNFYLFDKNFKDPTLRSLVRVDYFDMNIDRSEMLSIFSTAGTDGIQSVLPYNGTISTNELNDLKQVLSNDWALSMRTDIRFLANRVVNGDRANQWYQGGTLGNLVAGDNNVKLNKLIDKWFKGGDLPAVESGVHYENAAGSLFVNGAAYTDVDQGGLSDCYFLCSLGEVAQHAPSRINNMFIDNGDGTFAVKFYHGSSVAWVTVNRMLAVNSNNVAAYADWSSLANGSVNYSVFNSNNELWVALAEKAYAQINESGWIGQSNTNSYVGIEYGYSSKAFNHITGKSASDHNVVTTFGDSRTDLINAVTSGKAVSISSKDSGTNTFIVHNHCYLVVGYDATTKKFELFNPWGLDAGSNTPARVFVTFPVLRHDFLYWTSVTV